MSEMEPQHRHSDTWPETVMLGRRILLNVFMKKIFTFSGMIFLIFSIIVMSWQNYLHSPNSSVASKDPNHPGEDVLNLNFPAKINKKLGDYLWGM